MSDSKFSVSLEIEWLGYAMDNATMELYVKSMIENGSDGVAKVAYIDAAEVDEFEYGMGDQWGRK